MMLRSFFHKHHGSVIIEMAIAIPVFIFFILGIIEFAVILYLRGSIESAVRGVSRMAIVGGAHVDQNSLQNLMRNRLNAIVLDNSAYSITTRFYATYDDVNAGNASFDGSGISFGTSRDLVQHRVEYAHRFLTPVGGLIGLATNNVTIVSTAFSVNEDY